MWQSALLLALTLAAMCTAAPAEDKHPREVPPQLLKLLQGPERADIPCKFKVFKPVLTFQQQYIVLVRGVVPSKVVEQGRVRHLHVLLKAQDERGQWLEGSDYEDFEVPPGLARHEIEYLAGVYVRPGAHRLVIAVYDSVLDKANVYYRTVRAPALKNDPLPNFDALLPEVEFPGHFPDGSRIWPVSQKLKRIRVENSEPARLDVVLNVSKRSESGGTYRSDIQRLLQTASVVGRMQLAQGCVRVSVVDVMRMSVLVDRKNADEVDWNKLQEQVEALDQNTIDISVLENQRKVARFTHDYLAKLAADSEGCGKPNVSLAPYVAVISHDFVFPEGSKIAKVSDIEGSQFFYLHHGSGYGWTDAMGQILNSAKTEKITCFSPGDLRKAIARISSRLVGPH